MLKVSDSAAKYKHFVVVFDAGKAVATAVLARFTATVARYAIFVIGLVLFTFAVVAVAAADVGGTP